MNHLFVHTVMVYDLRNARTAIHLTHHLHFLYQRYCVILFLFLCSSSTCMLPFPHTIQARVTIIYNNCEKYNQSMFYNTVAVYLLSATGRTVWLSLSYCVRMQAWQQMRNGPML